MNFFNDLFDSVNGDDRREDGNELRCSITENSNHHAFWVSSKNILRKMTFVDKISRSVMKSVPTLKNWLLTIDGFQKLWKILNEKYEFRKLNSRFCNQDPLENFFGQIRSHAARNINPTPRQFQESFFTLLVNNMQCISVRRGNCESTHDPFNMLCTFEKYLEPNNVDNIICNDDEASELITDKNVTEELIIASSIDRRNKVINLILKDVNFCTDCENSLRKNSFLLCMKQLTSLSNKLLGTRAHRRNILKVLLDFLENWNANMDWHECIEHHANMYKIVVRVIAINNIVWWCNHKNEININNENIEMIQSDVISNVRNIKRMREAYKNNVKKRKILQDYKCSVRKKICN